jgi:hypothetical protein
MMPPRKYDYDALALAVAETGSIAEVARRYKMARVDLRRILRRHLGEGDLKELAKRHVQSQKTGN